MCACLCYLCTGYEVLIYPVVSPSAAYAKVFTHLQEQLNATFNLHQLTSSQCPNPPYDLYLVNSATRTALELTQNYMLIGTLYKMNSSYYGGLVLAEDTATTNTLCRSPLSGLKYPSLGGFFLQYKSLLVEHDFDMLQSCNIILRDQVDQVYADLSAGRAAVALVPSSVSYPQTLQVQFPHSFAPLVPVPVSTTLVPQQTLMAASKSIDPSQVAKLSAALLASPSYLDAQGWRLPEGTYPISQTLTDLGLIHANICTNGFYDSLQCRGGLTKIPYSRSVANCQALGLDCTDAICLCHACHHSAPVILPVTLTVALFFALTTTVLILVLVVYCRRIQSQRPEQELTRRAVQAFGKQSRPCINHVIGTGGHATVYAGVWNNLQVAFKICDPSFDVSEASMGIAVHHQHIVETYAYAILSQSDNVVTRPSETSQSELWLVLERCDAGTHQEHCQMVKHHAAHETVWNHHSHEPRNDNHGRTQQTRGYLLLRDRRLGAVPQSARLQGRAASRNHRASSER